MELINEAVYVGLSAVLIWEILIANIKRALKLTAADKQRLGASTLQLAKIEIYGIWG